MSDSEGESGADGDAMSMLQRLLMQMRLMQRNGDEGDEQQPQEQQPPPVLESPDLDCLVRHWTAGEFRNVIVMAGAGISVAAGIPDFRTPGTGLYDNLQKYNLKHPTDIFNIEFFDANPEPFFQLAKELYPGNYKPTTAHALVRVLEEQGVLLRCYTQNIDGLERLAGVSDDKLVEAHGTFATATCRQCRARYTSDEIKDTVLRGEVPKCTRCTEGVIKPDIVFFGESLPERFAKLVAEDFPKCDLLVIVGTSLAVYPFASLVGRVSERVPRLLVNREAVGRADVSFASLLLGGGMGVNGLMYDMDGNTRDMAMLGGDLQEHMQELARRLGWADALRSVIARCGGSAVAAAAASSS